MGRGRQGPGRQASSTSRRRQRPEAPAAKRGPYRWSEAAIEAELRAFVAEHGHTPSSRQLDRLGLSGLRAAICNGDGIVKWAERLGAELAPSQDRTPISEDEYRRQLAEVLAEHGPANSKALRRLGHARLASYVERRGGTKAVARQFGLLSD